MRYEAVLVVSTAHQLGAKYSEGVRSPNVPHIPKLLSILERRSVLEGCVSKWVRKLDGNILDVSQDGGPGTRNF